MSLGEYTHSEAIHLLCVARKNIQALNRDYEEVKAQLEVCKHNLRVRDQELREAYAVTRAYNQYVERRTAQDERENRELRRPKSW